MWASKIVSFSVALVEISLMAPLPLPQFQTYQSLPIPTQQDIVAAQVHGDIGTHVSTYQVAKCIAPAINGVDAP